MKIIPFIFLLLLSNAGIYAQKTKVSIKKNQFLVNGKPTYEGRTWQGYPISGLLMNARMVQGIFDDLNPSSVHEFAYPDTKKWDPERNTNEFVQAMSEWQKNGLNAFTLNMQGGSPYGYGNKSCLNPGYHSDGSLMPEYMNRLEKVLQKADELEMVVILGLFYFGQDQHLRDEAAVINAVDNITNWMLEKAYKNVLIEINNECDYKTYDHDILKPARVHELIKRVQHKKIKGHKLLVSTSFTGRTVPTPNVVKVADFILLHGNGAKDPKDIQIQIDRTKKIKTYKNKPLVNNEDDHYDFDKELNNFSVSIKNYVSWGFFDFRRPGEADLNEGYQSVPVNWNISSERKRAFFAKVKEITQDPSFSYWNEDRLELTKKLITQQDPEYLKHYQKLLKDADKALLNKPNPVINKTIAPPSGDKHDYLSLAPYFWPDSSKKNGLPWIRRDGEINPMRNGENTDEARTKKMFEDMKYLTMAYYFSKDQKYARKIEDIVKVWFVDTATKVNPNLNFGQGVPGQSTGRPFGIIEWSGIAQVINAVEVASKDQLLAPETTKAFDQWLSEYLNWLQTSKLGLEENNTRNNHGNWYDYQVIGIMKHLGLYDQAKAKLEDAKKRIASQIAPNGSTPEELSRTKSVSYTKMNLQAMCSVADIGRSLGVDLWAFETADGRSLKKAFEYLEPYVKKEKEWEYQQIGHGAEYEIENNLKPLFGMASSIFGEQLLAVSFKPRAHLSYIESLVYP